MEYRLSRITHVLIPKAGLPKVIAPNFFFFPTLQIDLLRKAQLLPDVAPGWILWMLRNAGARSNICYHVQTFSSTSFLFIDFDF